MLSDSRRRKADLEERRGVDRRGVERRGVERGGEEMKGVERIEEGRGVRGNKEKAWRWRRDVDESVRGESP